MSCKSSCSLLPTRMRPFIAILTEFCGVDAYLFKYIIIGDTGELCYADPALITSAIAMYNAQFLSVWYQWSYSLNSR
jgi:hypothetical protein